MISKSFYDKCNIVKDTEDFRERALVIEKTDHLKRITPMQKLVIVYAHELIFRKQDSEHGDVYIEAIPNDIFDLVIVYEDLFPCTTRNNIVKHFKDAKKVFIRSVDFVRCIVE